MIINDNVFTEIGDTLTVTSSPITGFFSFFDFETQTQDETTDKYFDYFFSYAKDGIHFTETLALTPNNLTAIADQINYKDSLVFKFTIVRSGTDDTGTIEFNDLTLQGNYIDILDSELFKQSILSYFKRASIDFNIESWAINVLQKIYEKGVIPNFLERNINSNYEEDRDFIKYWKTICQYFATYVVLARDFARFYENEKLLLEFLKQRNLFFCEDDADYNSLTLLMKNYYDEIKKRGTIQIIRKGELDTSYVDSSTSQSLSQSISQSLSNSDSTASNGLNDNRNLNGEFLRLLCYHLCDEFIFNFRRPEKFGWNLRNTSPMYRGTSNMLGFNKAYEDTEDILDRNKYPIINNPVIADDDDLSILRLKAIDGNGKVGIGFDINQDSLLGDELIENNLFLNPALLPLAPRWVTGAGQNPLQFDFSSGNSVKFIYPDISTPGVYSKFISLTNIPIIGINEQEGIYEVRVKIDSNINPNTKVRFYFGGIYTPYAAEVDTLVFRVRTVTSVTLISIFVDFDPTTTTLEEIEISLTSIKPVLLNPGTNYSKSAIDKYGIVIDQNTDYEITFFAKSNQEAINDGGFYFGALIFDCDENLLELRDIKDLSSYNLFLENYSFAKPEVYYFVRGIVFGKNKFTNYNTNSTYKKGEIVRETGTFYRAKRSIDINTLPSLNLNRWEVLNASQMQRILSTNLNHGTNLIQAIDTHKIVPLIYCKHPSPNPSASIKIYDLKIKPVATDYSTGFIQADHWLDIFAKNRNQNYSNNQIDEILRRYLLPYDIEFKTTFLEIDDQVIGRFNPNGYSDDPTDLPCQDCGEAVDFISNPSIDGWYVDDNSQYLLLRQGGNFGNMLTTIDEAEASPITSTSDYYRGKCYVKGKLFVYNRDNAIVEVFENSNLVATINLSRSINSICYDEREDMIYYLSNDSGKKVGTIDPNTYNVVDDIGIVFPGTSLLLINIYYNPVTFEKYITASSGSITFNYIHIIETLSSISIKSTLDSSVSGLGLFGGWIEFNLVTGDAWIPEQYTSATTSQIRIINPITYNITIANCSTALIFPSTGSGNGTTQNICYYPGDGTPNSSRMFVVYKDNPFTQFYVIEFLTTGTYVNNIFDIYPIATVINLSWTNIFNKLFIVTGTIVNVYDPINGTLLSSFSSTVGNLFKLIDDTVYNQVIYHSYISGSNNIQYIGISPINTKLCQEGLVNMYLSNAGPYKWNDSINTWQKVIEFFVLDDQINSITISAILLANSTAALFYSLNSGVTWVQLSTYFNQAAWSPGISFIKPSLAAVTYKIVVKCDCGCTFNSQTFT